MIPPLVAAALAGALLGASPADAAVPRTSVVDLGGARAYVRTDATATLAGVQLFVRAGLDRQAPAQSGLAALAAESILHTPVLATSSAKAAPAGTAQTVPLADAIDARGGSLTYVVSPQYVRFFLEAPPDVLPSLTPLVARALAAPSFDPVTLAAARTALGARIADDERDPRLVGLAMLRASYYRDGAGTPPLGTSSSLAALSADAVRAFYSRYYLRGDAFVAAVGRTGEATDAVSRALVAALPAGSAPPTALGTRPFANTPKRIVTRRDVFAPYVVMGFAAPPLGDRDFPAALVMRSMLGDVFDRVSATTLPQIFRPIGTIYGYETAPAQFALWLNGARIDPSVGIAAVDAVLKGAAAKPINAAALSRYKDSARGEWALETLSLDERAWSIGNAVAHGLDADAADGIGAAIAQVTAADVQRVAKKYFQHFDVALVLPREGSGG